MNTYVIFLTCGKIIEINGTSAEWNIDRHQLTIFNEKKLVGVYNTDNIAGWTESKYLN